MAKHVVYMPKLSDTMEEGGLSTWLVEEGSFVEEGEPLCEIETDKATMEYASPESGYLLKALVAKGSQAALGEAIAILGDTAEEASSLDVKSVLDGANSQLSEPQKEQADTGSLDQSSNASGLSQEQVPQDSDKKTAGRTAVYDRWSHQVQVPQDSDKVSDTDGRKDSKLRLRISPLARKMAQATGIKLGSITGSGPLGRVVKRDVESYLQEKPKAGEPAAEAQASESQPKSKPVSVPASVLSSPVSGSMQQTSGQEDSRKNQSSRDMLQTHLQQQQQGMQTHLQQQQQGMQTHLQQQQKGVQVGSKELKVPLTMLRKSIAKNLTSSKQSIPHFYLTTVIAMDNMLALREELNAVFAKEAATKDATKAAQPWRVSINDLFAFSLARALKQHALLRSSWAGDHILQRESVDLAVAVSVSGGLVTPVVRGAENYGLEALSRYLKEMIKGVQDDKERAKYELSGGCFTLSNLGMSCVQEFSAIINPPQSGILAVGKVVRALVPNDHGDAKYTKSIDLHDIRVEHQVSVTLSCDHRVVDGMAGAEFLNTFKELMENPSMMLR